MIKVYDRDGKERGTSVSGDMYIRDLRNTKGHISPCTHAQWHPTDRFTGMTSSEDGSIRVWDTWNVLQKTVIKPQLAKPGRVAVTACAYNHDGGLIGGGMFDGTLQIWDVKGGMFITIRGIWTYNIIRGIHISCWTTIGPCMLALTFDFFRTTYMQISKISLAGCVCMHASLASLSKA